MLLGGIDAPVSSKTSQNPLHLFSRLTDASWTITVRIAYIMINSPTSHSWEQSLG